MRSKPLALILALVLLAATNPALAAAPAVLEGAVLADASIAGARIELADRAGAVVASAPVAEGGSFLVESIPAGAYRVAVTTPEGTYASPQTLTLAPGSRQNLQIAVKKDDKDDGSGAVPFWSTGWGKFTGVAIIVGGALLGAALIDPDEDSAGETASESTPTTEVK